MRILIFSIIIVLFSCTDSPSKKKARDETALNESSFIAKRSAALNLPRIDRGVDSFELRLWSSLTITDLRTLTILRFSDGQWHCTETQYWMGAIGEGEKNRLFSADSIHTKKIMPSIAYSNILDSLKQYEIWQMSTQERIPGFVDRTADGMTYTLEIAEPNNYHSITYRNPQAYTDAANVKFTSLLKFLHRSVNAFIMH